MEERDGLSSLVEEERELERDGCENVDDEAGNEYEQGGTYRSTEKFCRSDLYDTRNGQHQVVIEGQSGWVS